MGNVLISELYRINALRDDVIEIILAAETHPVFKAHFEGNPLLPAFLQIDILSDILALNVVEIVRSKFMEPIRPLDVIRYTMVKDEERSQLKVKLFKGDKTVSEFTLAT